MNDNQITQEEMQRVYEEMKTLKKLGMVLYEEGVNIDCPNIYRMDDGKWGMIYARHVPGAPKEGYETWLASSVDLIQWTTEGKLLTQSQAGWDSHQLDGGLCLLEPEWEGSHKVLSYNGKYWMTYIGGNLPGYEPDPLSIGIAWADQVKPGRFVKGRKPIMTIRDSDVRPFEKATLYKSTVLWDKTERLGYPFIMYYNAKQEGLWIERIGMAVSSDMINWKRFGTGPVMELGNQNERNIVGDPQIIRYKDLWVMHYFVAYRGKAWDTFACSKDLVHWKKWNGTPLMEPSEPFDKWYAHKPYVLKVDRKVYHFYCAVGERGRGIAVAVSE